jgi:hypothetical protein
MSAAKTYGQRVYTELDNLAKLRGTTVEAAAAAIGMARSQPWRWRHGMSPRGENVERIRAHLLTLPSLQPGAIREDLLG